jgi:hypothetical protein
MNANFSATTIICRNDSETVTTDFEDAVVLLHINSGQYYSLDEISAYIWELMATPVSITEVVTNVCNRYECTQNQCMTDTIKFLEQLSEHNLLQNP